MRNERYKKLKTGEEVVLGRFIIPVISIVLILTIFLRIGAGESGNSENKPSIYYPYKKTANYFLISGIGSSVASATFLVLAILDYSKADELHEEYNSTVVDPQDKWDDYDAKLKSGDMKSTVSLVTFFIAGGSFTTWLILRSIKRKNISEETAFYFKIQEERMYLNYQYKF